MFFEIWIEKKKSNFFFFRLQLFNLIIVIIHCTRPTICYDRCSRSTFVCCWRLCCAVGLVIHWHNLIIWVTQCQIDLQSKQKKYVQICCNCTWFTCIIWKKKKKSNAYRNGCRHWFRRFGSGTIRFTIFRLFFNTGFGWIVWDDFCNSKLTHLFNRLFQSVLVSVITHQRHLKFRFSALIFWAYPMSAVHCELREWSTSHLSTVEFRWYRLADGLMTVHLGNNWNEWWISIRVEQSRHLSQFMDLPINDKGVVYGRFIANRTIPCGLSLVHL